MSDPLHLLKPEEAVLLVIDTQEKLHRVIADAHTVMQNVARLARGAAALGTPIFVTEQYPKGVGPTEPMVKEAVGDAPVIEKVEFGCFANEGFCRALAPHEHRTLVLCGFETHVCVLQTALQARAQGRRVYVVSDAVGSRAKENKDVALARLREGGCVIVSTEMLLFEMLRTAASPAFKTIHALVK